MKDSTMFNILLYQDDDIYIGPFTSVIHLYGDVVFYLLELLHWQ